MPTRGAARLLGLGLIVSRLAEVRFAKANEQRARDSGAHEFGASHYPAFWVLHPLWLLGMLLESNDRPQPVRWRWLVLALTMQPLRQWTMRALGPQWTTRVLVVPGAPRIATGPYRFGPHPAYVGVTVELLAAPMAVRAPRTALLAGAVNAVLLLAFRLPAEAAAERFRDETADVAEPPTTR